MTSPQLCALKHLLGPALHVFIRKVVETFEMVRTPFTRFVFAVFDKAMLFINMASFGEMALLFPKVKLIEHRKINHITRLNGIVVLFQHGALKSSNCCAKCSGIGLGGTSTLSALLND